MHRARLRTHGFSVFKNNAITTNKSFNFYRSFHSSFLPRQEVKRKNKLNFTSVATIKTLFKYSILAIGSVGMTISISMLAFFIYDSTTYPENTWEDFETPIDIINPKKGGPENLPIMNVSLDCAGTFEKDVPAQKPRLVILGSGWATAGILSQISKDDYDVTVISPTNYFLFTPLLPSAATFTLDVKSLKVPLRKLLGALQGHFIEGWAEKVEVQDNLVKVTPSRYSLKQLENRSMHFWTETSNNMNLDEKIQYQKEVEELQKRAFYVPYDKLIIAVGATLNTHGVEGLEYCSRLKSAKDVIDIRKKIKANFELACLPTTSETERKRLLSFVIAGGGATGCEFAAEVSDMINEEVTKLYSKLIRRDCSIHIIQSRQHILNTYDKAISEFTEKKFLNDNIDVQINSRVQKVLPDKILFRQKVGEGEYEDKELPFGVCLWSTGMAQNKLTKDLATSLGPELQRNKYALETDSHLIVKGCDNVYCIGDASTVRTDMSANALNDLKYFYSKNKKFLKYHPEIKDVKVLDAAKTNNLHFSEKEVKSWCKFLASKYPATIPQFNNLEEYLKQYENENNILSFADLIHLLKAIESKVTSLPLTAQRAHQQGKYLGDKLHKYSSIVCKNGFSKENSQLIDDEFYKPFKYNHMGSLAYIGNSAVFDMSGYTFFGGLIAMYLWRSVYFSQCVSIESRCRLFSDWLYRGLFGRDLSVEE
ncbi:hypothetical protein QEN19_001346 [Hanseniaspora menglaensis]